MWTPALLIAGIVLLWVGLALMPDKPWPGSGCLVRQSTGIYCPGCGGMRAARHLATGEWKMAAESNLLLYPIAAGLLWGMVARGARCWAGKDWWSPLRVTRRMMLVSLAVITVFTLVRNLEAAAFLRP